MVETLPPYECYNVKIDEKSKHFKRVPWKPFTDPSTIPATFRWTDAPTSVSSSTVVDEKKSIPELLIAVQGAPISCRVMDRDTGKILHDYGDKIYLQRNGGGCGNGNNFQEISPGYYYVGEVTCSVGSNPTSVIFRYAEGFLVPLSCEFQQGT